MMLPRTRVENFSIKKFCCPMASTKFFNAKKYNMKICNTNIFRFTVLDILCKRGFVKQSEVAQHILTVAAMDSKL